MVVAHRHRLYAYSLYNPLFPVHCFVGYDTIVDPYPRVSDKVWSAWQPPHRLALAAQGITNVPIEVANDGATEGGPCRN